MIRTNTFPVPNFIVPRHVLVSVFDKSKLDILVECILRANSDAMFYSTGGTGAELRRILGSRASDNYVSLEAFTGCPEMEGGLVKTLHPKVFAGLLAERGNPAHESFLANAMVGYGQGPGVYFDALVVNTYPFQEVVRQKEGSEFARCNIDIGGPSMIMASAKNWHSVTVLTNPDQYEMLSQILHANEGRIPAEERFKLAVKAMRVVGELQTDIHDYFRSLGFERQILPQIELAS